MNINRIPQLIVLSISLLLLIANLGCASSPCSCSLSAKAQASPASGHLVLMTDFSERDGAVSAMRGVAYGVSEKIQVSDLTHEIPPYNIWDGAYRLNQTYQYWPKGTVFVAVVDPGVGSSRHSLALKTSTGHFFVGPDNGLFTLVAESAGIDQVVAIDESKQRLKGSNESYTFHGRDLYAYVGARLAAGQVALKDLGSATDSKVMTRIQYQRAEYSNGAITGMIPVLDINYGNVWSNVPKALVLTSLGDQGKAPASLRLRIRHNKKFVYDQRVPLVETFAAVPEAKPLLYFNSLMNLSVALNMADFAKRYKVGSGPEWTVELSR